MHLFKTRIRALRESLGWPQDKLAGVAGIDPKTYQRLESGKQSDVKLSQIEKIAAAHRLDSWELIGRDEPITRRHPGE